MHASEALEAIKREMAFDPRELERVEERLFACGRRPASIRSSAMGCPRCWRAIAATRDAAERGEALVALEADAEAGRGRYRKAAAASRARRARRRRRRCREAVEAELPDLKLGRGAVHRRPGRSTRTRVAASGFDQIAFHVQTNPGTAPAR